MEKQKSFITGRNNWISMNKKTNGITLIALVITIIILLILAGVSIASLGENGLFNKTKQARTFSRKASAEEVINLKLTEIQLKYSGKVTLETILEELKKDEEKEIDVIEVRTEEVATISCEIPAGTVQEIDVIVNKYDEFTFTIGKIENKIQISKICGIDKDKWNGETVDTPETERNPITITAEMIEYNATWNGTTITNAKQALDYLYTQFNNK